ncbi:MAG: PqqD family protein [Lentisphaeria bacterium]|nr:PqqD family protein [Lentisphaeria bacterium]
MLKPRPGVILKIHGDERCLFDVRQGLMLPVNKMAAQIWRNVEEGVSEEEIVRRLRNAFAANPPESLADDIHAFLHALQLKRLLISDETTEAAATQEEPTDDVRDGMPLYYYYGMYGVMHSGYDAVVTEETPFAEIQPGDVVAIHPDGPCKSGRLFRVVKRTQTELTVQGDAEPRSARRLLHACDAPQRVAPQHLRHAADVHGGKAGMRQFRWHRICRIGRVLRDLLAAHMPWRKNPKETAFVNGEERYFDNYRLIARRWNETTQYLPWWNCFRYKLEEHR